MVLEIESLTFVEICLLVELIFASIFNRYLLLITYLITNPVRTIPLNNITYTAVSSVFLHHWVFVYGLPKVVLSDNGTKFNSQFFTEFVLICVSKNFYTTTYNLNCNGKFYIFNRTILSALRHYVSDHPKKWDQFTDALTFSYNTHVQCTTNLAQLQRAPQYGTLCNYSTRL